MAEFRITLVTGSRGTFSRDIIVQAQSLELAPGAADRFCRNGEWVGTVKPLASIDFNQPVERVKLSGIDLL